MTERCGKCNTTGKFSALGWMPGECEDCKGVGYKAEPVILVKKRRRILPKVDPQVKNGASKEAVNT